MRRSRATRRSSSATRSAAPASTRRRCRGARRPRSRCSGWGRRRRRARWRPSSSSSRAAGARTSDVGAALRLNARVDGERRLALLEESIGLLETAPWRLELARALADYGAALRVARRRSDAHEPLRRAAELADACGARALRTRALDGLAALGDRPRKLMFSGAESLTASERRIAELAGRGASNRDIAQDLFVTPKTVENHLGRVYMKLGIKGRRELAAALA